MKTKELNVPAEIMTDFANLIADHEIDNEIMGATDEGEIIIEVRYEKEDRQGIFELMEMIDDYYSEEEEENQD
jgi:hypothetical protein